MVQEIINAALAKKWNEPWPLTEEDEQKVLDYFGQDPWDFDYVLKRRITDKDKIKSKTVESIEVGQHVYGAHRFEGMVSTLMFTDGTWCVITYHTFYECEYMEIDNTDIFPYDVTGEKYEYLAQDDYYDDDYIEGQKQEDRETSRNGLESLNLIDDTHKACLIILEQIDDRKLKEEAKAERYKQFLEMKKEFEDEA